MAHLLLARLPDRYRADSIPRHAKFNGMTEQEVIDTVKANILYRWPATDLRMTTHWGKTAIDVPRNSNLYYEEPETPPFLYQIASGY